VENTTTMGCNGRKTNKQTNNHEIEGVVPKHSNVMSNNFMVFSAKIQK
jgi:hypothetical protein